MASRTETSRTQIGTLGPRPAAAAALALALLAACGGGAAGGDEGDGAAGGDARTDRPSVVVSVPPLAWFVDRLAGDRVAVSVMVPPGASPATYEPAARQVRAVGQAELYVAVGHPRFPFEAAWLDDLVAANPEMRVVRAGAGCPALPEDPHVWLSTRCATRMAGRIAEALRSGLERPPADLEERRTTLEATMDSVASRVARLLEPHRGRAFLVFHPALGYLAREHGLRQIAVSRGPSGPGPAGLSALVRRAREAGIHTVFVQPQFSREAAEVVAGELPGGRVVEVDPLARDWAAAMVRIADRLAASFVSPPPRTASGAAAPPPER